MSDTRPSIAELQRIEREMDRAPWYSAESLWQSDCVLTGAPDADFSSDGRVVVQANPNFPYRANLDGIVGLRNAAPVLLEIVAAALAYYSPASDEPGGQAWAAVEAALAKVRP
jgi:hypothetical protein